MVRNCVFVGDVYCLMYYALLPTYIKPSFPVVFRHKATHANVITTDHSFYNKRNSMSTSYKDHFYITKKRNQYCELKQRNNAVKHHESVLLSMFKNHNCKWEHWDNRFLFLSTKTFFVQWMIFPPLFKTFKIIVVKLFIWISQISQIPSILFLVLAMVSLDLEFKVYLLFQGNF